MSDKTIRCEACEDQAKLARSVKMRNARAISGERVRELMEQRPAPDADRKTVDTWIEQMVQAETNAQFQRAFVCEPCYKVLDNDIGIGVIGAPVPAYWKTLAKDSGLDHDVLFLPDTAELVKKVEAMGGKVFNLAGESRRDKAAVYRYGKWLAYQKRTAGKMGIKMVEP